MKKIGLIVGISFLAGAIFFALAFGVVQKSDKTGTPSIGMQSARAEAAPAFGNFAGNSFAPLVSKVKPAVVKVTSETIIEQRGFGDDLLDRFFNFQPRKQRVPGIGSGFFISSDGYLITNNHVVKDSVKVKIKTIDDKEYTAKIIGTDPKTDIALLKVNAENLPFIQLGDSDKAEVGEWVLAIGNPLGQDLSVTAGIISAKGRELGISEYEDFLQTDASINSGNSGGPLINMEGKVIGINSVILSPSGGNIGLGFAIPSNLADKVIRDIKTKGRVVRAYLGINIQTISDSDAKDLDLAQSGALITGVEKDSPADKAGLKKYDLIISINGKKVKSRTDIIVTMVEANPGDTVTLVIQRDKKEQTIRVKVGEAPDSERFTTFGDDSKSIDLGMVLIENSRSTARQYGLKTSIGLVIKRIDDGGAAQESGFREGDVILEVNGKEVNTIEQFRKIISAKQPGSQVMVFINRDGDEGMLRLRLPE